MSTGTSGGFFQTALEKVRSEPAVLSIIGLFVVWWRWPKGGDNTSAALCVLLILFSATLMVFQFVKYRSLAAARRTAPLICAQIVETINANIEGEEPDPRGPLYAELVARFAFRAAREEEPYSTLLRHISDELEQEQRGFGDPEDFSGPVID
jgi:hypothetical protein